MADNDIVDDSLKEEGGVISLKGEVVEILPNSNFKIKLPNGVIVIGYSAGKMRKNRIKVLQYDTVNIELSVSDLDNLNKKGAPVMVRVTFRYK